MSEKQHKLTAEEMAKVCHDVNKAYCESLGDNSQMDWEHAPMNIRQSAIDGVSYRLNNPSVTPKQMHDNWSKFKVADGWVFGPVKDLKAKTHPCLVPYEDLPADQKLKDTLFSAVVKSLSEL